MKLLLCISALVATIMANDDLEKALKNGNDQFTANMFQEVAKAQKGKSCVLSAFSVLSPLGQLALASTGPSHDEILKTIGFANDDVTKEVFSDVNKRLKNVQGVDLRQANKVYVKNGLELNDQFAGVSKDVFNSEVQSINFSDKQKAADDINAWVEDHTNKRIKNLVDPNALDDSTSVVLVNAIYFKGKWLKQFNANLTQDLDFHVTKDKTVKVPMMTKTDDFKYGESAELDAKILEMQYEGEQTSLVVVLPNKVDGIDGLVEKLKDPTALNNALNNMYTNEVVVTLPKFKIETTTNLKEVLQKMNINKLFSPGEANLNKLLKVSNDLYVSDAVQKAFIEVNEEGAEAAAANAFIGLGATFMQTLPKEFAANHPFLFFIKQKNIVLFNGLFKS